MTEKTIKKPREGFQNPKHKPWFLIHQFVIKDKKTHLLGDGYDLYYLILQILLCWGSSICFYFIDEETEAQRGQAIAQGHTGYIADLTFKTHLTSSFYCNMQFLLLRKSYL